MADCTFTKIEFPSCCKRRVEADFAGGEISSNGGALLLSLADRRVGLLSGLGRRLADRRQAGKVKHGLTGLLRQRVFALALGDEDVNDHEVLRDDLVLQDGLRWGSASGQPLDGWPSGAGGGPELGLGGA